MTRKQKAFVITVTVLLLMLLLNRIANSQDLTYNIDATCWDSSKKCKKDKGQVIICRTDSTITIATLYDRTSVPYSVEIKFKGGRYFEIPTMGKGKTFIWIAQTQIIYLRPYNKTTWYKFK
jgi:hypothetical protein